jgi:hypothetical protein
MGDINPLQQTIHRQSFQPLHKYIAYLIPYLEQRQDAAKRLYTTQNLDHQESLTKMIEHCNTEIMKILDIPSSL